MSLNGQIASYENGLAQQEHSAHDLPPAEDSQSHETPVELVDAQRRISRPVSALAADNQNADPDVDLEADAEPLDAHHAFENSQDPFIPCTDSASLMQRLRDLTKQLDPPIQRTVEAAQANPVAAAMASVVATGMLLLCCLRCCRSKRHKKDESSEITHGAVAQAAAGQGEVEGDGKNKKRQKMK